jgi:hypothetical protein
MHETSRLFHASESENQLGCSFRQRLSSLSGAASSNWPHEARLFPSLAMGVVSSGFWLADTQVPQETEETILLHEAPRPLLATYACRGFVEAEKVRTG